MSPERAVALGAAIALAVALRGPAATAAEADAGVPAAEEPAPADGTAEAKRLFAEGTRHYAAAEWEAAAADFSKAYELTQAPELLYNLARCYEHMGDAERAVVEYRLYLRMSPDAEDRAEVETRIVALQPAPAKDAPAQVSEGAQEDEEAKRPIRLALESGVDVPLIAEWSRLSIPVDALLAFGLTDWLYAGFGLTITGFAGEKPVNEAGYPTGAFGLHGDLAVLRKIRGRLGFTARLSLAPTWIFRFHEDNVFLLVARGGVGLHIDVWRSFGILVEGAGGVGGVFNRKAEMNDNWSEVSLAVDVGGRVGITYAF